MGSADHVFGMENYSGCHVSGGFFVLSRVLSRVLFTGIEEVWELGRVNFGRTFLVEIFTEFDFQSVVKIYRSDAVLLRKFVSSPLCPV